MSSGLGKVILLGEHAVVYGHPALAGAIDRHVRVRIAGPAGAMQLTCKAWDLSVTAGDDHPVARGLAAMADAVGFTAAVRLEVTSSLPAAAGLGSSAALCVAVTRALAEARARSVELEDIERIANLGEAAFHDRPSGVDVALAARGGIGVFRRGHGLECLPATHLEIAVGLSGEPRRTGELVTRVAHRREQDPGAARALGALGALAEAGARAVRAGDPASLGALFDDAQRHLAALELSSPGLDRLIELARGAGATGAKLSGAGGGGAVIAVGDDLAAIVRAWTGAGFDAFVTTVGALP